MPSKLSELSKPQLFVVTLPDVKIEITVNGRDEEGQRIVRFELRPLQAQSFARSILQALDNLSGGQSHH